MKFLIELKPDSLANLRVCRFLFYSINLVLISPSYFFSFSQMPEELWLPTGILSLLDRPIFLSEDSISILSLAWFVSGALSALGLGFRFASVLFCVLQFLMFNIAHSYGYLTHTYMPLVLVSMALAFGGNYTIFLTRFIFCSIFFSAGLSKVINGGIDWVFSDSMQNILLRSGIYYHDIHRLPNLLGLNLSLASNLLLSKILAFATVALELLAPLALFSQRLRLCIIGSLLIMQVAIYFLIFVNFKVYAAIYVFWISWENIFSRVQKLQVMMISKFKPLKRPQVS